MHEQLQQVPPEKLTLAGFGVLVLLTAALIVYAVLPQWRAYTKARSSLITLEQGTATTVDLDAQLDTLRADVEDLQRTLHGDTSNLPLKQVEAFVIGRLQKISWANDVELVGVKPREGAVTDQFHELLFDLELSGDYFDFFDWLIDVSDDLGFIVVKQFEMSPQSSLEDETNLRVRLTMASYRNAEN